MPSSFIVSTTSAETDLTTPAVWATTTGVLAGRPCIVRLHSIEALQTEFPARVDWSQVVALTTVGPDIAETVRTRFPAAPSPVVIPNGIDVSRFAPSGREAARRALGLPLEAPVVGVVSGLWDLKGPDLLLEAMARTRSPARLDVIGAGPL